jgi:hypothetical protein
MLNMVKQDIIREMKITFILKLFYNYRGIQ